MLIPGFVVALATFPGVIVHEIAHLLFCRLARVAVFKVVFFRLGNPSGYVLHELPRRPGQQILIGIGPFLVNTVLGAIIAAPAAIQALKFKAGSPLDYVLLWLGVSIAMHSFPSTGDAAGIWKAAKNPQTPMALRIIAAPLVGLIYLCAVGSVIWLDFFYGVAVAMLIPNLVVYLLA